MKTSTVTSDETPLARPKYYEMDGALRANANRAWLLAFLTIPDRTAGNRIRNLCALAAADGDSHWS